MDPCLTPLRVVCHVPYVACRAPITRHVSRQWQPGTDTGSAGPNQLDHTAPAKLSRTLAEGEQAHTHVVLRRQADSVIADLELECIIEGQAHDAAMCLGVAH